MRDRRDNYCYNREQMIEYRNRCNSKEDQDLKDARPLVTIVIPAYNAMPYLKEAIESVRQQTYTPIELIVVDDGSTDETGAYLEQHGDGFRWYTQRNQGQSAAINGGWELAEGEIISYLSADDALLPHAVEAAVETLQRHPEIVMAYGDYELIDEWGRVVKEVRVPEFHYDQLAVGMLCQPGPGVFLRRDAVLQAGGWDTGLRQMPDYAYWLKLASGGDFRRIPRSCAQYRVHDGSQTYAPSDEIRSDEPLRIMSQFLASNYPRPSIRNRHREAMAQANLLSARLHMRSGRPRLARSRVAAALRHHPATMVRFRTIRLLLNGWLGRLVFRLRRGRSR